MAAVAVFIVGFMCGAAVACWACKGKIFDLERQLHEEQVRTGIANLLWNFAEAARDNERKGESHGAQVQ